jgi:hypothetical protein
MRTKFSYSICIAACAIAVASIPIGAHHGDANRYIEEVIVVSGTVLNIQLINPHSMVVFEVEEPNGKKVRWQGEMGAPQQLIRDFRWTKDLIKPGDKITLTGRRPKSGAPYLNLTERANIVLTDSGKEIFRTPNYGQPAPPQK